MYECQCTDVFFEGTIFNKHIGPVVGGMAGRVQVGGVGGDREIWTQFSICLGADYLH